MEWYESLFLQMCGHVITQTRVKQRPGSTAAPKLDVASTRDLVDAYKRGVGLAFDLNDLQRAFQGDVNCVLLILVHEHQFSSILHELKKVQDVALSATLRTDAPASDFSNYHVDVALVRQTSFGTMPTAH
ncbi:hypothetical protein OSW16_16945 [Pseudomonas putida]|uniref:hypothetical protein n=1 Tax=Pseudomonas putida TaxID=303 RepID=UPI002270984C|nr:hypothetical protein [Pseudomonas putida]WAB96243.1 hypothetical protein OSW16_16945 [Pseudomonas putida]